MQKHSFLATVLLLTITTGCQPNATDRSKVATENPQQPNSPLLADDKPTEQSSREGEIIPDSIPILLSAGATDSPLAPRYSPPGKGLELKPVEVADSLGVDGLETEVVVGSPVEKQMPIKMLVTRAKPDEAYSKLYIDSDSNGKYDEEAVVAMPSESRGNIWSNFSATLKVKYIVDKLVTEDYPVTLWLAVASAAEQPKILRISRRGFKTGEMFIGDKKVSLVLSDSNNDAVFGEGDWWELRTDNQPSKSSDMRKVGDYVWLGESAYKLELNDATGNAGRLSAFDPGKTREQDELARDPYAADKKAARAERPLEFRHDADEAIAEAAEKKLRCFIKFETTWCGPCKTMTQYVFTAKDVVEAAAGVVCVKVDGDERKDLVERYSVKAYPTGVMISSDASEEARFVGYQKGVEMTDFLKAKQTK